MPIRAKLGMVATQCEIASRVGAGVIQAGGTAVDAAVATAFALAVTHPTAGNIGGDPEDETPAGLVPERQ